jgi:hypothetical protein
VCVLVDNASTHLRLRSLCGVFVATIQVRNYTETGFLKIKAPEAVFSLVKEFWENNKEEQTVEWKHPSSYHNTWDAPTTIIRVDNTSLKGGGPQLYAAIANAARDAMEVSVVGVGTTRFWWSESFSPPALPMPSPRRGRECHRHPLQCMVFERITTKAFWPLTSIVYRWYLPPLSTLRKTLMKIGCLKFTTTKVSVCDVSSFVPDGSSSRLTRASHDFVSFLVSPQRDNGTW